jgi:hypothetical protein
LGEKSADAFAIQRLTVTAASSLANDTYIPRLPVSTLQLHCWGKSEQICATIPVIAKFAVARWARFSSDLQFFQ